METDAELVERTLAGDLGAFEALVRRHRDVVFRVAARLVGRTEAQDVSQEAFLRAFHRLERFRGEGTFRAWLLQITHNTAVNALERAVPEPVEPQTDGEPRPRDSATRPSLAEGLEQSERRERLEAKIRTIQPTHRAVLVLRDVEGLSYDEIARVTQTPIGSVKGRLHRARNELIDLLRRNTYDWQLPE